ncbi:MAG: hypothetical protein KBT27_04260 [Prevotellaceae bacterium]|nr:hypothetical protein [Candidatus Faecinaster equi]
MNRTVILFITVFLCLSSYGQSLRAIRDSLEVHYGFASVQSNNDGIWFLVGVPGEAEEKVKKKGRKYLSIYDGKPSSWICSGGPFRASYKLGVCDITGKEIIAPGKSFKLPTINGLFTLEDGTEIDCNGAVITQVDEKSNKILGEYLKEVSDELKSTYNFKYSGREYISRKADTLTVYSVKGEILSQIIDSSVVDFKIGADVVSLKYDSGEFAFYDYYGREIFPKGQYDEVRRAWFGYQVHGVKSGYGVVSFSGKKLLTGHSNMVNSEGGCLVSGQKFKNRIFYKFDGSFICLSENIDLSDGGLISSREGVGSCCTVIRNIGQTKYAIIDAFGDYILPFTEASCILYNEKRESYVIHGTSNSLGNRKKISLGINQFGRVFAEPKEVGKFGYHLLNGVLGFATGLAVVATAGTAAIGGVAPETLNSSGNNPQYVQTNTYLGGGAVNGTTSSEAKQRDKITGSNFQNYEGAYDKHADTLTKMYYGQYRYSDSERSSIQREMRTIREKVNSQNVNRKIFQSSWETWNGSSKYLKY